VIFFAGFNGEAKAVHEFEHIVICGSSDLIEQTVSGANYWKVPAAVIEAAISEPR